jgi:tetratricopeptide (TPR) repeat protein
MRAIPPETREELDKLERKHAENPEGRYFVPLANALRKAGDTTRAKSLLRDGLGRHPDYVSAHIVLGRCLQDDGSLEDATAQFSGVLSLDPQNLVALRSLGDIAVVEQRLEDARKWYGLLLEVDPMNEEARQALDSLPSVPAPAPESEHAPDASKAPAEDGPPALTSTGSEQPWIEDLSRSVDQEYAGDQEEVGGVEGLVIETEVEVESLQVSGSSEDIRDEIGGPDREDRIPTDAAVEADEADDFGEESAVITETIAELYTRQGLYDRAEKVYRELIRRRGSGTGLEERLARVRRLAAGEDETRAVSETIAAAASSSEGTYDYDPFADSFSDGFPPTEAAAERSEAGDVIASTQPGSRQIPTAGTEPSTIRDYLRGILAWSPTPGRGSEARSPGAAPDGSGFEERLDEGIGHGISAEADAAEPEFVEGYAWAGQIDETSPGDPLDSERAEEDPSGRLAWLGTTIEPAPESPAGSGAEYEAGESAGVAGDQDAGIRMDSDEGPEGAGDVQESVSADADLFPWELPSPPSSSAETIRPDHTKVSTPPPRSPSPEEAPADWEPRPVERGTRNDAPAEPSDPVPPPPTMPEDSTDQPRASDEDDDDLESFQAWLRSLKR